MLVPTKQQQRIINATGNCTIIAKPGSGKTFVVSEKVRKVLQTLLDYQGVIAISFTNKASNELKTRCLKDGIDRKSSFFGTIDKFYVSEIIFPFGKHLFGLPVAEIKIFELSQIKEEQQQNLQSLFENYSYENLSDFHVEVLRGLFRTGTLILESIPVLALYVFDHSKACRNYLAARYTHIIIDEYQDVGKEQHRLFFKVKELGLTAIAVGDVNQSIFAFAGKNPEYLISLSTEADFTLFPLDKNHRCHSSIINYSAKMLSANADLLDQSENRVFELSVTGSEIEITDRITKCIDELTSKYGIENLNGVGILVRGNRTGQIVDKNLGLPHKYFVTTPLDTGISLWAQIFRALLYWILDNEYTTVELIEDLLQSDSPPHRTNRVCSVLDKLLALFQNVDQNTNAILDRFQEIALFVSPNGRSKQAISDLRKVLSDTNLLNSYRPPNENEIQIMTLHKAKGLEFEMVFHLDLYEYILPAKRPKDGVWEYSDFLQDLNLHYVGVTRSKKCCVLCTSTIRHRSYGGQTRANASEFLTRHGLESMRLVFDL